MTGSCVVDLRRSNPDHDLARICAQSKLNKLIFRDFRPLTTFLGKGRGVSKTKKHPQDVSWEKLICESALNYYYPDKRHAYFITEYLLFLFWTIKQH